MDQVTQQNAALVEESAAAAASMQEQAGKLAGVVGVFRLGREDAPPARAPRPASATRRPALTAAAPGGPRKAA
jgi:methyl-accepting chemotaxis protein